MINGSRILHACLFIAAATVVIGAATRTPAFASFAGSVASSLAPQADTGGQAGGTQAGGTQTGGTQAGGTQAGGGQAGGTQTGGAQAGGTQAGAGQAQPPAPAAPAPAPAGAKEDEKPAPAPLAKFGDEIFAASRAAIRAAQGRPTGDGNAFQGPAAGPMMLGNVLGTPPETYQLGPGDKLTLRVTTPFTEPVETKLTVDATGAVLVPATGRRYSVRGQTLSQVERQLTKEVGEFLNTPTVTLTLDELRTFSISVLGESFAPGVYQVPSTFSLFNLILATGGPSVRGSLRTIMLRRNNAPGRTFDLYKFLSSGDAKQDVLLQPGDVIFYPVAKGTVSIDGEVNRPGIYELSGKETLSSVLSYASGIRPSGVSQNVAIDSVVPGSERRLLNINLQKQSPESNPEIRDGDKVNVFSIRPVLRNAVTIIGPVEQPRAYAFREGMSVSDLVKLSLGLRPEAVTSIAELRRPLPDGGDTLIRVNLAEALKGSASANITLQANDTLRIFDVNDVSWMGAKTVNILGAVRSPGVKTRAEGMRVGDLIREARGLELDAYAQEAYLQRFERDGTPAELLRIDLAKAALGDPAHDILLQDRDELRVYRAVDLQASPTLIAVVTGSVQRTGNYPLAKGLKVKDLVTLAGGPTLDAFLDRAFIQRMNTDGTVGPILTIDLRKAIADDPAHNIELQARDQLNVLSLTQARFQTEQTVTIKGGVQRPGAYPASSNLTLSELIALAGGLLPDASGVVEISKSWMPIGQGISQTQFQGKLGAWEIPSQPLEPGDVVSVFQRSDVFAKPRIVTIMGAVSQPGTYVISKSGERVSDIVKRAGGLAEDAYPRASEYIRDPKLLATGQQRQVTPKVLDALQKVAEDEYRRATALLNLDRLRLVFSQGATIGAGATPLIPIPGGGGGSNEGLQPGVSLDAALAKALTTDGVTKARALNEADVFPVGNLNARVDLAIDRPRGKDDIVVMDGDVIIVPIRPTTVTVTGAVMAASSIVYVPGANINYYLGRSGGLTRDADKDTVLVIRATGELIRFRSGVKIEVGDTILVPTKTQGVRFREDTPAIQNAVNGLTSAATTLAILRALR